ncbi:Heat shock factor (HSF)-type, DNA-binding domain and Winged helix-turn-helix DNA-binding domain-containing protein [Strongyloides ratti]|uniref:Heat shock factor (HSF)-type, DNA-binding domain and Winged helix-turn-helix DNA-binding domain-containing protein n=1 Tax=Strongyloides ratti TaxID=34506 RepID=A0A090LG21_STRRB|nr:Heat shock factor (HSF)-type, DNA-binding domain and Winged helix-turn-helix DNA-binding domain-containing protein [Strongyloides ratti]CEF66470.1 Heat shock factor (HSF)-type, DNA-binding domain and Winged helix-turn-helix DNA-binding domain-containing protein [Strongyloides ratti]
MSTSMANTHEHNLSQINNTINIYESCDILSKDDDRIPVFLTKLWSIVNDPDLNHIVEWDESGLSFHIQDSMAFSRDILPQYFKHNNLNSCIRQLNMYGFRKITAVDKKNITENQNLTNHLEFFHNYFVRDRYDLLLKIKRRTSTSKSSHQQPMATAIENMSNNINNNNNNNRRSDEVSRTTLMEEIKQIGKKQIETEKHIVTLKQQNETIWKEIDNLSAKCKMQQGIIKKLCSIITILGRGNQQPKIIRQKRLLAIPEINSQKSENNLLMLPKDEYIKYESHDEVKYYKNFEENQNKVVSINDNQMFFSKKLLSPELIDNINSIENSYCSMDVKPYNSSIKNSNEINDHLNLPKIKVSRRSNNRITFNTNQKMSVKNNCINKAKKVVMLNDYSLLSKQTLSIGNSFCENSPPTTNNFMVDNDYEYLDIDNDFISSENNIELKDDLNDHMSEDYLY